MARSCPIPCVAALALLACGGGRPPEAAAAAAASRAAVDCGPQVSWSVEGITVVPGGSEDTAALQCALDAAVASGDATTIRLAAGTFRTAQLVTRGFVGTLRGSGPSATVLTNVPRAVPVAPVDFFLDDPSAENPWPALVAFVGGRFSVSDLSVRIIGEAPTTGWSIFGVDPPIQAFSSAFMVVGASATARFSHLEIAGAAAPDDLFGLNLVNGVYFQGYLGSNDLAPLSGRFEVRDCHMRELGSPAPVFNLRDADVAIVGNRFEGTLLGGELVDVEAARYVFAGNRVDAAWAGMMTYDNCIGGSSVCGLRAASVTVAGNVLRSFDGVDILSTIAPDARCTVVGNDITYDVENGGVAVLLDRSTRGCFVVTDGAVLDRGTDNRVVNVP